jgi:hypothetical protein
MKLFGKKIPEQVTRLSVVLILVIVVFVFVRSALVPPDFGKYGHYRASAVDEIISQEIKYAGHVICYDCHDDVADTKSGGYHKNVSCEVCHGPAAMHIEENRRKHPGNVKHATHKFHEPNHYLITLM